MCPHDILDAFEERLGYRFQQRRRLERALTHRSWANEQRADENYERSEFLGDAVLGLLAASWLYERFPELSEGELSKLKSFMVSEAPLVEWAERWELGELLRLGVGEERSGGRSKRSLLADAFEAVLGAVFLDGGITAATELVEPLFEHMLGSDPTFDRMTDAKTTLQELVQGRGLELPDYRHVAQEGPDHHKRFHVECWVGKRQLAVGVGSSKKQAEQSAARAALGALNGD